jgi:hypothetical protein
MTIQSIRFDKLRWTESTAEKWLSDHNLVPIKKFDETKHFFRYRLRRPNNFQKYFTKKLDNGIDLIIQY